MSRADVEQEQAVQDPIRVCGVRFDAPVGKVFYLKAGKLQKQKMVRPPLGLSIDETFPTFEHYADWRETQDAGVFLTSGTWKTVSDGLNVVLKDHVGRNAGAIAAAQQFLSFNPGTAIARIDTDVRDESETHGLQRGPKLRKYEEHDDYHAALLEACPFLDGIAGLRYCRLIWMYEYLAVLIRDEALETTLAESADRIDAKSDTNHLLA